MTRFPVATLTDGTPPGSDAGADGELRQAVALQLVETLYNQTATLVIGGVALATAALVAWLHTREAWFMVWVTAIVIVLAGRLALDRAFHRRPSGSARTGDWRRRFIVGAWAMGALCGVSACSFLTAIDWSTRLLLISVQIVIIMGAATRNAGSPTAANGQIVLGLSPLFFVSLMQGDSASLIYCVFIVFQLFAALTMVRHLHRQAVRLLYTAQENRVLVDAVRRANIDLAAGNVRLEAVATTDSLTSIANRRRFDEALSEESRRAQREGAELSLLMLDIDAFKGYNDLYGHPAGDDCLRRVARGLTAALRRPADLVARYGGEEFVAVLPQTGAGAAAALAEQVRADIEALAIQNAAGINGVITVSIGVATCTAEDRGDPEDFIRLADEALYAAKGAGRNCVRVAAHFATHVRT